MKYVNLAVAFLFSNGKRKTAKTYEKEIDVAIDDLSYISCWEKKFNSTMYRRLNWDKKLPWQGHNMDVFFFLFLQGYTKYKCFSCNFTFHISLSPYGTNTQLSYSVFALNHHFRFILTLTLPLIEKLKAAQQLWIQMIFFFIWFAYELHS